MASPTRAIHRSLLSQASAEATAARHAEIEGVANPLKRTGLKGLDGFARLTPGLAKRFCGVEPQYLDAVHYSDTGFQSTVYRTGSNVLKLYESSIGLTRREQERLADTLRDEHARMAARIGERFMPPEEIDVGAHPFDPDHTVIRILQQFRYVEYLRLVGPPVDELTRTIRSVSSVCPTFGDQVKAFVEGNLQLLKEESLSADIIGYDNIGIGLDNNHLTLTDGQPLTSERCNIHKRIPVDSKNLLTAVAAAEAA